MPTHPPSSALFAIAAAFAIASASIALPRARACAPAPEPGAFVSVTDEEALIVWDAARRVQHFVRRARFDGTSSSVGFLVPTPTRPELAEADDRVFSRLWDHTRPRIEHHTRWRPQTCCTLGCGMFLMGRASEDEGATASEAPVTVLESARVAGTDASVLAATDATALAAWLNGHGFERSAALDAWLAQYVRLGWIVTAFRYAKSDASAPLAARAVRMTFTTDRPFFPYREPAAAAPRDAGTYVPPRVLRVYFVGDTRTEGVIGDAAAAWGASTEHARPLGAAGARALRGAVPEGVATAASWLTSFTDLRAVRPTDADLLFGPAADRSEVDPVFVIEDDVLLPIPIELAVPIVVVVWLFVRRRRKRRPRVNPGT